MPKKTKINDVVKAIVLYNTGDIGEFKLVQNCDVNKLDINKFPPSVLKVCGKNAIERECDFSYLDNTISIFAWTDGKAGTENKHELPPPIDKELYFGNIFVILHQNGKVKNLSKSQYEEFYEISFGGFEDIGSSDSCSSEEEIDSKDSIHDFIVDDQESEDGDYSPNSLEEKSLTSGSDTTPSDITMSTSDTDRRSIESSE